MDESKSSGWSTPYDSQRHSTTDCRQSVYVPTFKGPHGVGIIVNIPTHEQKHIVSTHIMSWFVWRYDTSYSMDPNTWDGTEGTENKSYPKSSPSHTSE